jgi:hypothetical protein
MSFLICCSIFTTNESFFASVPLPDVPAEAQWSLAICLKTENQQQADSDCGAPGAFDNRLCHPKARFGQGPGWVCSCNVCAGIWWVVVSIGPPAVTEPLKSSHQTSGIVPARPLIPRSADFPKDPSRRSTPCTARIRVVRAIAAQAEGLS